MEVRLTPEGASDRGDGPSYHETSRYHAAMTGRGLSLLDGLGARCGVDPVPGDGKVVWAELDPTAPLAAGNGDVAAVDVDALLARWADADDGTETPYTVRLGRDKRPTPVESPKLEVCGPDVDQRSLQPTFRAGGEAVGQLPSQVPVDITSGAARVAAIDRPWVSADVTPVGGGGCHSDGHSGWRQSRSPVAEDGSRPGQRHDP